MPEAANRVPAVVFRDACFQPPGSPARLDSLSLEIPSGVTLVLLGRSGSGKTTTLKLMNRLLPLTAGELLVEGRPATDWDLIHLRRRMGYAIQDVGLFPHYTVERNIGLLPAVEGWTSLRTRERVRELMALVGLDPTLASRYPRQLSGGQRQRVGVARALALDPPILLMDEPFGALDPLTRAEIQGEFARLQRRLGKTIVLVTHDLREALLLGSQIALLDAGRLAGLYTPAEFLRTPDPLAAAFREAFSADGVAPAAAVPFPGALP
ncbi:MAG TPA: ATP-binding cassette domain-containing protein [Candidatus Acidoferrales bacterium]|nr:ATP-binding cassette domain-containing protein [Candidatus Acidoferrales bacterium]